MLHETRGIGLRIEWESWGNIPHCWCRSTCALFFPLGHRGLRSRCFVTVATAATFEAAAHRRGLLQLLQVVSAGGTVTDASAVDAPTVVGLCSCCGLFSCGSRGSPSAGVAELRVASALFRMPVNSGCLSVVLRPECRCFAAQLAQWDFSPLL